VEGIGQIPGTNYNKNISLGSVACEPTKTCFQLEIHIADGSIDKILKLFAGH
jgi:hypothetical protein